MTANVLVSTENLPYEEWLEYRRTGIGGSDAAVVCGISRYKSPVELWMEKTGQLPSQEAGEAAYWGNLLESLVREEFTKRTGISVTKPSALYQSEEHPFMLANVDGLCEDPAHGPCIFEAKTASAYKAGEWEDSIPDEYMIQIQHYMAVTGYQGAYIAVLIGGNAFRWKFVGRDEELIAMLISLEDDFWRHVQNGTPPALDGSNASARFLAERFPNSVPQSEIALPGKAQELLSSTMRPAGSWRTAQPGSRRRRTCSRRCWGTTRWVQPGTESSPGNPSPRSGWIPRPSKPSTPPCLRSMPVKHRTAGLLSRPCAP